MFDVFTTPYLQRALLEIGLLSVAAGVLGTWIVLRGLAFFAHAVGTAAFPGLVLADGLAFAAPVGAFVTAVLFAGSVAAIAGRGEGEATSGRTGYDALTALVLVGCLAAGVLLASDVFRSGSGVEGLLFGSLLLIDGTDLALAGAASLLALLGTWTLGPRWLIRGFDPGAAPSLGVRSPGVDHALLLLVALAGVAAVSSVGALLVSALFVVPAATVRLLCDGLRTWQLATVGLVVLEGVAGLWLSVQTNAPPGATIAVVAGGAFVLAVVARAVRGRGAMAVGIAILGCFAVAGCGASGGGGGNRLDVVATTTQLGDFTRAVGGDRVTVHQILQPNTDPHDYEPRPGDIQATANAKVVLLNGDGLDHWMGKVVSESGTTARVIDFGASVPVKLAGESDGPEASRYDPHWWHDPRNVQAAVERIRDVLVAADPRSRARFEANARAYLARLERLDAGLRSCFAGVAPARRKLVTDHDAFDYFARRYGVSVVGAVIPSQSTQAQPSAGDVAKLTELIRREQVSAVFPESSVSPRLAKAIARDAGASSSYQLYGDTLGAKGSSGATYLTMERANAEAMVRGFTSGARGCAISGLQ